MMKGRYLMQFLTEAENAPRSPKNINQGVCKLVKNVCIMRTCVLLFSHVSPT